MSPRTPPAAIQLVIEDLHTDIVAESNPLQDLIAPQAIPSREAIRPYLERGERDRLLNPRSTIMRRYRENLRRANSVRSIQRVRLPAGRDAAWIAQRYFSWLPRFIWPLIRCDRDNGGSYAIRLRGLGTTLLRLDFQAEHSTTSRQMFFITGGLLASERQGRRGRMEFCDVLEGRYTIIAIHDFAPALPWNVYEATQAAFHKLVMAAFRHHVERAHP